MSNITSVLTELQGLRGENLLTKALAVLIRQDLVTKNAQWVTPLFTNEKLMSALQRVDTEQVLRDGDESLGRVDMILHTEEQQIAVEVKLEAAFQVRQLERYAKFKAGALCVLAPHERLSGVPDSLPDADDVPRPVYKLDWEKLQEHLAERSTHASTAEQQHALLRRAFLQEEIRRFYKDYYRVMDPAAMRQLQDDLDNERLSSEAAKASTFLDGIRRLPALRGLSSKLASAAHYVGFDVSFDEKGPGPLGWIGFVDTKKYKLSCDSQPIDGWRLVLCRAVDHPPPSSGLSEAELGLRLAVLEKSPSVQGITRHAKADAAIYDVPKLLGDADDGKPEELWNQRILAVFGDIAREQAS